MTPITATSSGVSPVVDSHHHFWDLEKFDYDWMPEGSPLRVNFGPEDLRPLLKKAGVERTVIVQAHQSLVETRWLLELAEASDYVAGVVGWVDLTDPNVGDELDKLQRNPWFKGVRHIWEGEVDAGWLDRPEAINGLKEIERRGICYDFLVRPPNLPYVPRIMEKVPDLKAVIDHIAKPDIKGHRFESWLTDLRHVASIDGMRCKVSGMITEADHANWSIDDLRPYVNHVVGLFGTDRLMFGTDWPVCTLAGSYEKVVGTARKLFESFSEFDRNWIFGGTATDFYCLKH
jgi:L-fuconolactonase